MSNRRLDAVLRKIPVVFEEHGIVVLMAVATFCLIWHRHGFSDALWIASAVALGIAQIVFVVHSLAYAVYRDGLGVWYLPTLCLLVGYGGVLLYLGWLTQLLGHSILSTAAGVIFFVGVVWWRRK